MSGNIHSRQDSEKTIIREDRSTKCVVFICVVALSGLSVLLGESGLCKLVEIIGQ